MSETAPQSETLSKREQEVADVYAAGKSYKEIARELGLSPTTIRTHLRTVYSKLGVTSKIELSQFLSDPSRSNPNENAPDVIAELALELDDAIRREKNLAKVLRIISSREPTDDVINEILAHALDICEADFGVLFEYHGDLRFSGIHHQNISPSFADWLSEQGIFEVNPNTGLGLVATTRETVNISDVRSDDLYEKKNPLRLATADLAGARSFATIPLLSRGALIGAFVVYRKRVHPFNERSLELAQVFADQAAIAIENARQFNELKNKLEREAATKQVLEAIAAQSDDEMPAFEAILSCAEKLCKAVASRLFLKDPDKPILNYVAVSTAEKDVFAPDMTLHLDDPTGVSKAVKTASIVHQPDLKKDALYEQGHPDRLKLVDEEGIRAQLAVPLLRGHEAIGVLTLNRVVSGPFSEDEIALVESFAAQAVIAIENIRQFKALEKLNAELGDRVEKQVGEIERMGKLKRFLPAAVADTVVSQGADSILSSHRALLGVLFCDIRGFTAFCETAEPEETIEVLQTYHEEMGKLINDHSAGVDHRMGDGIMVLFNDPVPCDDPAGQAIKLAIAMRARMIDLSKKWKKLGHRLGFGVGVSLGYATVGMVGYEGRYDYTASGTAVNLAARLCDHAKDGEILLSPRAFTAVEDEFSCKATGEVSLKGIREPVEVYRLMEE